MMPLSMANQGEPNIIKKSEEKTTLEAFGEAGICSWRYRYGYF